MSDFGLHSALVEEVLTFVENKGVLREPYRVVDDQTVISTRTVNSLEDIDRFRDPDWPNSEVIGDMAWLDIQRVDEHTYCSQEKTLRITEQIKHSLSLYATTIYCCLSKQFGGLLPENEINRMGGTFDAILYTRALFGADLERWHEKLFRVYQAGGYPCGWAGAYPDGELIVYSGLSAL